MKDFSVELSPRALRDLERAKREVFDASQSESVTAGYLRRIAAEFAAAVHAASSTPRKQDALIAEMLAAIASGPVPLRPHRSEPRAKKRRPKNYRLLTQSRHTMTLNQHRNRWKAKAPKPALS